MKKLLFILFLLQIFHQSYSQNSIRLDQMKDCRKVHIVENFTSCEINQRVGDDLMPQLENEFFSKLSTSWINLLGADYPLHESLYPCVKKIHEFGYTLLFQSVDLAKNNVKLKMMVIDKCGNLIEDKFLGVKQIYHSQENVKRFYFKFINEATLEVNCQIMDYTQSNLIEESFAYYSVSKNGITVIPNASSKGINSELILSD